MRHLCNLLFISPNVYFLDYLVFYLGNPGHKFSVSSSCFLFNYPLNFERSGVSTEGLTVVSGWGGLGFVIQIEQAPHITCEREIILRGKNIYTFSLVSVNAKHLEIPPWRKFRSE